MNGQFTADGRMRGSYVYMLLCQLDGPIHVKVGMSVDPFARLGSLRSACPVIPEVIAIAELANSRKAKQMETALHEALKPWHSHLEWFRVQPAERALFNAAWRPVVAAHSTPSRPVVWRQYSVPALIADARRRQNLRRARFKQGGAAYRDFVIDSKS